jgi:hypothetical protein
MAVQEHHDVAHRLLLGPARRDLARPELADAGHLTQSCRVGLDHLEGVEPELTDDPFGELRPDPPDHAGPEIAGHSLRRRRRRGLQHIGLELETVRAVGQPDPDRVDVLAGRDRGRMPDERHQIPLAARLHPDHREAGIRVVERDPLDAADQRLAFRTALALGYLADVLTS